MESVAEASPVLVALAETWLSIGVPNLGATLPGSPLSESTVVKCKWREEWFSVQSDISAHHMHQHVNIEGFFDALWCRLPSDYQGFVMVGAAYRFPIADCTQTIGKLRRWNATVTVSSWQISTLRMLIGIDWWSQSADTFIRDLFTTAQDLGLYQHARKPARAQGVRRSILDLVFSPQKSYF